VTILRICHLPKPIPDPYDRPDGDTLLDITFGIGTSWGKK
jgi:hypothetical protein